MSRVASFDVFDTVLTRTVGSPDQVFTLTGERLVAAGLIPVDAAAYAATRRRALADLTTDVGHHPTVEAVAVEVASRLGLPPAAAGALVDAELELERRVLRAVPGAPRRLQAARERTGRGVVFVSDTPLPEAFLREVLEREGLLRPGDDLFTSAARGASKQEGGLFDLVAGALGVPAAQFVHTGDDPWSDLAHARRHGWQATPDRRAVLTPRERRLDDAAPTTGGLGARFAGAARTGRLQAEVEGRDPGLAGIAGAVATPLLAGFGLWVLAQARLLELDRLYFVARDGEVFLDVTRQLVAGGGDAVECRYLYGSRKSWQLAATGTAGYDPARHRWFPDDVAAESLTARAVLARGDLTPEQAHTLTGDDLFTPQRSDLVLGPDGWGRLQQVLLEPALAEASADRARTRRDLLIAYLDQEHVTAPGRVGLVDVGWTGRAARALEDVLVDADRPLPAAHLFLGLLGSSPAIMGPDLHGRSRGWLLDEARGRTAPAGTAEDPVMLIETFAMGSEGHTLGYFVQDGRVAPELVSAHNKAAAAWGFADYRASLSGSVAALLDGPELNRSVDLRPLVWRQLLDFWRRPGRAEAAAWGAQPYSEDFDNAELAALATPVGARRLLTRVGLGPATWRRPTFWTAGTVALSPTPWRQLLRLAERAQRAVSRGRRIPSRLAEELARRRPGR